MLRSRGVARRGAEGELELLVQDYPYAEDALSLWNVLATYVRDTLVRFDAGWISHVGTSHDGLTPAEAQRMLCACTRGDALMHAGCRSCLLKAASLQMTQSVMQTYRRHPVRNLDVNAGLVLLRRQRGGSRPGAGALGGPRSVPRATPTLTRRAGRSKTSRPGKQLADVVTTIVWVCTGMLRGGCASLLYLVATDGDGTHRLARKGFA